MGKFKVLKFKADKIELVERRQVSVDKINKLLDVLETEIEHWANRNGLDSLIGIADIKIASICVNAIRHELILNQQHLDNLKQMIKEQNNGNKGTM